MFLLISFLGCSFNYISQKKKIIILRAPLNKLVFANRSLFLIPAAFNVTSQTYNPKFFNEPERHHFEDNITIFGEAFLCLNSLCKVSACVFFLTFNFINAN